MPGEVILLRSFASSIPSINSVSSSLSTSTGCFEFGLVLKRNSFPSRRFRVQTPPFFPGNIRAPPLLGVMPSLETRLDMWKNGESTEADLYNNIIEMKKEGEMDGS